MLFIGVPTQAHMDRITSDGECTAVEGVVATFHGVCHAPGIRWKKARTRAREQCHAVPVALLNIVIVNRVLKT